MRDSGRGIAAKRNAAGSRSELVMARMHVGCRIVRIGGILGWWISLVFSQAFGSGLIGKFAIPAAAAADDRGHGCSPARTPVELARTVTANCGIGAEGLEFSSSQPHWPQVSRLPRSPGVHFLLDGLQMLALIAWGVILLWYLERLKRRTSQSEIGFRIKVFLFLGVSALSLAAWIVQILGAGAKNPLSFFLRLPQFRGLNILFVYERSAHSTRFSKPRWPPPLPTRPTPWRTAGTFLYWIKQLFRSTNGDNN